MIIIIVLMLVYFLCLSRDRLLHQFAIILLCFLFSGRSSLVPDTLNYEAIYNQNIASDDNIEIGFLYLCCLFKNLGFSFREFLFIITLLCLESVYYYSTFFTSKGNAGTIILLLISYFGLYYYGIVLRSAIAITLCYCGIVNSLRKRSFLSKLSLILIIIIASTIHISTVLFILVFIAFFKIPSYLLKTIICLSIFFLTSTSVIPISQYIYSLTIALNATRLTHYANMLETSDGAGILSWLYVLISILGVKFRNSLLTKGIDNYIYNCFLNLYIFGSLINSILWQIPGGSRVSMQFLFFEFIIIYFLIFRIGLIKKYKYKFISVGAYCLIKTFALFHYIPNLMKY